MLDQLEKAKEVIMRQREVLTSLMGKSFIYSVVVGEEKRTVYEEDATPSKKKQKTWLITYNGGIIEVVDNPKFKISVGCSVKCFVGDTISIAEVADDSVSFGKTSHIKEVIDKEHIEIASGSGSKVVLAGKFKGKLEKGSRVITDEGENVVIQNLGKQDVKFVFKADTGIKWGDIGGLEFAKNELKIAIEDPIKYADIYSAYGKKPTKGILLYGPPGCHAKGTLIVMYDGTIKKVEDISFGDLLMGPDGTPRKVLHLERGQQQMAAINPIKGEPFDVNINHILSVKLSGQGYKKRIVNLSVKEFLTKGSGFKIAAKLYKSSGIIFNKELKLEIDPYILGSWLGDGSKIHPTLSASTLGEPIVEAWKMYASEHDLVFKPKFDKRFNAITSYALIGKSGRGSSHSNNLLKRLKERNLISNKHIPIKYLTSSRNDRLQILAGIIDTDGSVADNTIYISFGTKARRLANDVLFLARSLGFAANFSSHHKKITYEMKGGKTHYDSFIVTIYGNRIEEIPTKVKHKKLRKRKQIKDSLLSGFRVTLKDEADYYGFTVDNDHLYLMGDFTVTHNCGKTMFGKAVATSIAELYGAKESGFIYIKGPEILNMYVGNTEEQIRSIFNTARAFKEKTGYPAVIFIDEAEAILSKRGSGRSSDIDKTIVPMFLSEMDGLEGSSAIVILTTNRPEMLDSAVVREGRIDKKIRIGKPDKAAIESILGLNLKKIPMLDPVECLIERALTVIMDPKLKLYDIKTTVKLIEFNFSDILSGAMVATIVNDSISLAIERDLKAGLKKPAGVTADDVQNAILAMFRQNARMNHEQHITDLQYELAKNNEQIESITPCKN